MRRWKLLIAALYLVPVSAMADRPVILVTPSGVFKSEVTDAGVPGPWVPYDADVVVQGFGGTPAPNPPGGGGGENPDPNPTDPVVKQILTISQSTLKDKKEATAVAAIIESLVSVGMTSGTEFVQALTMAGRIADTSMSANGRIEKWVTTATAVSKDPAKLKAGVVAAWGVPASDLQAIASAVQAPAGQAVAEEAIDFLMIIQIIRMIIELLQNLGII